MLPEVSLCSSLPYFCTSVNALSVPLCIVVFSLLQWLCSSSWHHDYCSLAVLYSVLFHVYKFIIFQTAKQN